MNNFAQYSARLLLPLALASALGCVSSAEDSTESPVFLVTEQGISDWEAAIPALMDSGNVTGLSAAITTDTGIVWAGGFGSRNLETGERIDRQSVFEAASLSKPVFAYAVLRLVDQGEIELDQPIADLYEYEAITHDPRHREITPRIVLTHSPGFPNWRPRGGRLTIDFDPGTQFSYSGEGFVYLQRAVMHHLREPLDSLVRRLVFDPLGMTNSSYIWQDDFDESVAVPHGRDGEVLTKRKPRLGQGNAAASLHTTAPDFALFLRAVMNGTGLSDSLSREMLSPQITVDSGVTWGLGIGLQDNSLGRGFWHWGDNTGYKAFTLSYPEEGVGIIWFTNSENGHSILDGLLAQLFGGTHPASRWLDYEQFNSPVRYVREELEQILANSDASSVIERYRELKATHPADAFNEFLLNSLGYRLLGDGRVDEAISLFELNIAEYPDASNPYDSMGEAYLAAGDTARAIINYQRSVDLDPGNTNGAAILQRLRGGLD